MAALEAALDADEALAAAAVGLSRPPTTCTRGVAPRAARARLAPLRRPPVRP